MKVKFKNETIKVCTQPTEQKMFRDGNATGWLLSFSIKDEDITSESLDTVLTNDNVARLTFIDDDDNELFILTGYSRITSAIIRYAEPGINSRVDIQITKSLQGEI